MTTTIIRLSNYVALLLCALASLCFFFNLKEGELLAEVGLLLIIALPIFRVMGMTRKYPMAWVLLFVWASIGGWYFFT